MTDSLDDAPLSSAQLIALNDKLRWACYSVRGVALVWLAYEAATAFVNWGDRQANLVRLSKGWNVDVTNVSALRYWSAVAMVMLSLVTVAIVVGAFWRLTGVYLHGRVFSLEAAMAMRRTALAGFAATLFNIVSFPVIMCLISTDLLATLAYRAWVNPTNLLYLLMSGFIFALSVILETAAEIADEHRRFV
jgi:hypothetical protein